MSLATQIAEQGAGEPISHARRRRLLGVMLLRIGLISVLLGGTIVANYRSGDAFLGASSRFLLALIAVTYLGTIVYAIWYRSGRAMRHLIHVQLAFDLVFWGCLTYVTGGIVSGFTFLFDLWVIVSAVVLGGRAAYYMAAASVVVLCVIVAMMATGALQPLSDQTVPSVTTREFTYFLTVNIVALFVVAGLVSSLVDRLERTGLGLEAERVRRADLAQLHADMIRSLTVGIATTGKAGEILMMNPAGLDILGLEVDEVEGKHLGRWLPGIVEQSIPEDIIRLRGNSVGVGKSGQKIPIEYIIAPLAGGDGSIHGCIVVFSDLTEVRRLEAELEHSRRLAALGELAASLAHEIRNPLGAISGSFQILRGSTTLSDEDNTLADIISRELDRLARLINEMLEYARPKQTTVSNVNIGKLVEEVVGVFLKGQETAGREVRTNIDGEIDPAEVDQGQVKQVLWNLLRNAVQATESGDLIEVVVRENRPFIIVEVYDTGKGIAAEEHDKIFDPFYSTRERGLGLGLALCQRIVDAHEGKLEAESREEGGSVFRVSLRGKNEQDGVVS
ncbi:MAG: PAS domain-containing protein [Deltaproteobacteria bacterium]|nr:PAS domain-containing protein [Deltaproteobacteria bacterium]